MSEHHRKMIRYSLSHMKFIEEQIEEIDRDIAAKIQEAGLDRQWQILQTVPGVQQRSAAKILAETGADMTQFPSQRNLSSWAGICPGNNRSAGKNRSNRPTGGNPWLRGALTECAWAAAAKKNCFLKEKFWRITTKSRGKKNSALLAVAHTIPQLVYEVLRTGQPYRDRQAPALSGQQKDRLIRHHVRRLGKLGIRVYSLSAGAGSPKALSAN
jgi:transposase